MTPTDSLRTKLRMLLNDRDSKTFTDDELDSLISDADCIYCAASEGWMMKATMQESNIDTPNQYQVGQERYQYSTITDVANLCYKNAEKYKSMCTGRSSFIIGSDVEINL
ncbi:hypothetical protein [Clostridium kluyveri]|uniref:Uncharacterized protein n=1 Tax=Clostridium kluyveri (strain ATCC 8527 / DSM 555 / NBRC 12016 / NCIMB 10680 / K1) TaxID=431943 RepID=A5MYM5_CLOK5|nr:hypothetical protein [Clostridium kluyveri]EDK33903.1 Conserved hypothetical protein [Clostridium kluyveri DSM 555]EDK33971.1 Hypothetical protein CKL_1959 [Clostridium kluyveri DSM 555]